MLPLSFYSPPPLPPPTPPPPSTTTSSSSSSSSTGSTAHCGPWSPAPTGSTPDKTGSGFTYKCDLPVHHLPVGSDWLPEPCYRFLKWFVLHDEVVSLIRNPLWGGPGGFLSGTHTPRPCTSHYSCGAAAAGLVCPEYFNSPVPSTYVGDGYSPIRHRGGTRWETANSTRGSTVIT
jgi:hypothetical protein